MTRFKRNAGLVLERERRIPGVAAGVVLDIKSRASPRIRRLRAQPVDAPEPPILTRPGAASAAPDRLSVSLVVVVRLLRRTDLPDHAGAGNLNQRSVGWIDELRG